MNHGNAGRVGYIAPHLAGAPGAPPHESSLLTRHGDEAEVAHRRAIRLGVPIDHDHAQSASNAGKRRGQAENSGADHGKIISLGHVLCLHVTAPSKGTAKEPVCLGSICCDGGLTQTGS